MLGELGFRNRADKFHGLIDDGFRHTSYRVPLGQMREFGDLDNIRHDMWTFKRHLVCQPGHRRAVWSRRRDENLDMKILVQVAQNSYRFFGQIAFSLRYIQEAADQDRKFVSGRHAEISKLAFNAFCGHDQRGNPINSVLTRSLTVGDEVVNFELDFVRKRRDFLQKEPRILARSAFLARDNQRRFLLSEIDQFDVAAELLKEALDLVLIVR